MVSLNLPVVWARRLCVGCTPGLGLGLGLTLNDEQNYVFIGGIM